MNIALFYHSLLSDWNHGNAHFLRGVAWELRARGHQVRIFEPAAGWSLTSLVRDHGDAPVEEFRRAYPGLTSESYDPRALDCDNALRGIDLAIVHEWTAPEVMRKIAAHRAANGGYHLLFHDTHHRFVSEPDALPRDALRAFDGVLAYGRSLRDLYVQRRWARRAWVWHEAADTRLFRPLERNPDGDLVWIGNWGDEERSAELREFLIGPVKALGLKAVVYGVRYPEEALAALAGAGIEYRGWIANFKVPEIFARYRLTVHIPRRAYAADLPGIPTIRPFEALACGIPLVCSPWPDSEGLFGPCAPYLTATDGAAMQRCLRELLQDRARARALAARGLEIIRARHTCAHRVNQLMAIYDQLAQLAGTERGRTVGA
jgi:spore maturation protein CgeB